VLGAVRCVCWPRHVCAPSHQRPPARRGPGHMSQTRVRRRQGAATARFAANLLSSVAKMGSSRHANQV